MMMMVMMVAGVGVVVVDAVVVVVISWCFCLSVVAHGSSNAVGRPALCRRDLAGASTIRLCACAVHSHDLWVSGVV